MAKRLATEYVKTCLVLTEAEMMKFVQMFQENEAQLQVKILENGSQEVVLQDVAGEDIVLSFERTANKYVCTGSCRISNPKLVNLMRKAVSDFKGDALVNRIFTGYTMVYHYNSGCVMKIVERKDAHEKIIYEHKDTLGQLEKLFLKNEIEFEITGIHLEVDELLDLRNEIQAMDIHTHIDNRLHMLTRRLYILEA